MNITQLVPGQELRCWSKLGIAIKQAYAPGTKLGYMQAPSKPGMAVSTDLATFGALVYTNDVENHILTLSVYPVSSKFNIPSGPGQDCTLHYTYFKRIRLISQINYPAAPNNPRRPTDYSQLSGQARVPYKKITEVHLTW